MPHAPELPGAVIVEGEPGYRALLGEGVGDLGFRAAAAPTATEGLKLARGARPDLVLLDLNLPVVSGTEFLEQFREFEPRTPVVIITGFGDLDSARAAIRWGVSEYLTKP